MEPENPPSRPKCMIVTVAVGLIVAVVVVIIVSLMSPNEAKSGKVGVQGTSTPVTVATKRVAMGAEKALLEQEIKDSHVDLSKGDFALNAYARLLLEYIQSMDVRDCYVCMQLPSSVEEGVRYHHLPLTYGITCSLLLSLFYGKGHYEYYYSNYDLVFSQVPCFKHMNKYDYYKSNERLATQFIPTTSIDTAYAHRQNLTCALTDVEKKFIDHVEDRRRRLEVEKHKGKPTWTTEEVSRRCGGSYGPIALDLVKKGKLCIRLAKSYYDTIPIGDSSCEHTFQIEYYTKGFLQETAQAIPNVYFVCGHKAYVRLPKDWYGTCYLAVVFPKIYHVQELHQIHPVEHARGKRGASVGQVMGDIFGAIIPGLGVILNDIKIRKLSSLVERLSSNTAHSLLLVDGEMSSIRAMVLQNRLALDVLLARAGGVCKMLKVQQCCTYIPDKSKDLRKYITNITGVEKEVLEMAEEGIWEKVGKGIGQVGGWFASLGEGIIGYILKPIIIIVVVVIVLMGLVKLYKWHRANRAERALQEQAQRLENLQDNQYERLKNLERFRQGGIAMSKL